MRFEFKLLQETTTGEYGLGYAMQGWHGLGLRWHYQTLEGKSFKPDTWKEIKDIPAIDRHRLARTKTDTVRASLLLVRLADGSLKFGPLKGYYHNGKSFYGDPSIVSELFREFISWSGALTKTAGEKLRFLRWIAGQGPLGKASRLEIGGQDDAVTGIKPRFRFNTAGDRITLISPALTHWKKWHRDPVSTTLVCPSGRLVSANDLRAFFREGPFSEERALEMSHLPEDFKAFNARLKDRDSGAYPSHPGLNQDVGYRAAIAACQSKGYGCIRTGNTTVQWIYHPKQKALVLVELWDEPMPKGFKKAGPTISNGLWQTHFADSKQVAQTTPYILWCQEELKRCGVPKKQTTAQWLKEHDHAFFTLPKGCHTIHCTSYVGDPRTVQQKFDTVRGAFWEGDPAFPGSEIEKQSHIQIAVRNPECVLGYFKPKSR
jgi:hypothetical protein